MSDAEKYGYEIAVVGMSGRFPGAKNLDEFWRNLRAGVESISFFSDEELLAEGYDPAQLADPDFVKAQAVLEDVELFDAAFFGFTPREAEMMDPQHRLFLECAWEALEDAACDAERYAGRIGVYAGESANSYALHNLYPRRELLASMGGMQTVIGNDRDYLATHASYKLNLKGPSLSVQTACSTSLVAVHLACQSLLNRECDMALAGGVSVSVPQKQGGMHQTGGIISPDGHCRAFDAEAQGTVKGNGVGVVVLKRLADALSEGDHIHAVIKGSALNNDGSLKVGFTAPSVEGQQSVIEEAMAMAAVEPESITYIEAHGTGTSLGDPIEVAALTQAFRNSGAESKQFCAIGSLKTNIGHTDAAAGIAGLIKTVLALKHKEIPPSLHYHRPNPNIDFASSPFFVNDRLTAWKPGTTPRRAGVSSFGIGGTNAHVVLEEAPTIEPSIKTQRPQLLTLSARTEAALARATTNLIEHLKQNPEANLADIAYTLQAGRHAFAHRRTLVCRNREDAITALETLDPKRVRTARMESDTRPLVFMFSGQGAQYVGMGRGLYESELLFRQQVDRCSELLQKHLNLDLRELLYPQESQAAEAAAQLAQTSITQPALFVIEYALAQLWMSWGLSPAAMIGHSIGEYAAACLAGVFSLEDALALVAARGRLMQQMPPGAMLALQLSEHDAQRYINAELSLAAINGPRACVLSGTDEAIALVEQELNNDGISHRRLHVSHALHSSLMDAAIEPFIEQVRRVRLQAPQIPYVSTLTGKWIKAEEATDPHYWGRHLRRTVRFADAIAELLKEPERLFLEIGPGQTLSALTKQQAGSPRADSIFNSLRHPQDSQTDDAFILNTLGQMWLAGAHVDWPALHAHEPRRRTPLPTYPFERQRYWIDPPAEGPKRQEAEADLSRKPDAADWFYVPSWKRSLLPEATGGAQEQERKTRWLIFEDETGLGPLLTEQLEKSGAIVASASAGAEFKKSGPHKFEINPRGRGDYDVLLKELRAGDSFPQRILHLWNINANESHASLDSALDEASAKGLESLIHLAQALGEHGLGEAVQLGIITSNLHEVTGEEELMPEKALLLGPCRVIPQEYPNINCRNIDIQPPADKTQARRLAARLIEELEVNSNDMTVAYRGPHRWTQIFEPVRWTLNGRNETQGASVSGPRLSDGGVYLLTGGLSDIDFAIASSLAPLRARLVFIEPANFPARSDWDEWLASHAEQDETSEHIQRLRALEASGAEVLVMEAEVSEREQVQALVSKIREQFGPINGVFHTAAVTGGGLIQLKKTETLAEVLAPKVQGTLLLSEALADAPPDFFVLFSTSLALTGVFGQVDYCAANAFLDAFAHAHTAQGRTFTVSINWHIPQWEKWQEAAMGGAPGLQEQIAKMREEYGISLDEGVRALFRILAGEQPQVVVSTQDFRVLMEEQGKAAGAGLLQQLEQARAIADQSRSGDYTPPTNELESQLAHIWQELFGIPQIGMHDNFFDLGGNSLLAIQLVSQIRKTLEIELPLSSLFEAPSIAGLAAVIEETRLKDQEAEEIERLLREIEGLSPDELQTTLAQELQGSSETKQDG